MSLTDIFNGAADSTLLANAVRNGNTEMVKKLLELGADINIPSSPPTPAIPMPVPQTIPPAPAAGPEMRRKPAVQKMATDRQVVAPATARFRKKQPKRQTTL